MITVKGLEYLGFCINCNDPTLYYVEMSRGSEVVDAGILEEWQSMPPPIDPKDIDIDMNKTVYFFICEKCVETMHSRICKSNS